MERVEEAEIIRQYVKDNPTVKFKDLANFIVAKHPDISRIDLEERIARITYNDYYAPNSNNASAPNQSR